MIRVFVVSPGLPDDAGGAQVRAKRHTDYLRKQEGFDARLIGWDRSAGSEAEPALPCFVDPIRLSINGYRSGRRLWKQIKLILHLQELFIRLGWFLWRRRHQFDVLHSIGSSQWFNLVSLQIASWLSKPTVTEMIGVGHDPLSLSRKRKRHDRQLFPHRPLRYRWFLQADAYVSKAFPLAESYRTAGLSEDRLFRIASAVDSDVFRPVKGTEERRAVRQRLGLNMCDEIVLFVGRVSHEKGLHWLLPAFRDLNRRRPQARLLIVGPIRKVDRAYAEARREEVRRWGLSDKVRLVGAVANVEAYMRAADVFVLPSPHEGFSGVILEAMASGLPIVASDVPGISQSQIDNGIHGVLFPVGDVRRMTVAIEGLLADPERAEALARAARDRVEEAFTFDVIGPQYMEMYRSVVAEHVCK